VTIIIIVLVAVVVIGVAAALVVSGRRQRLEELAGPPRAAMPDVLVAEVAQRPTLESPSLEQRLGSSRGVFERVRSLSGAGPITADQLDVVEEVLLRSDVGVATTQIVLDELRTNGAPDGVAATVRRVLLDSLAGERSVTAQADAGRVPVWLFVGVNGVGKTTTIGKLAQRFVDEGRSVVLAAGDTFRAEGADPGSVVHDALGRAKARGADIVLADTAGRRANSTNLLDELSKVRRVADRDPGQVVETFMVLDATTGQNALSQAREFLAAATVTGIVLTKLDGTARGGIVVAIERELGIPVKFVGVGEGVGDLIAFDPLAFVESLLHA
jgi:fused signal recognition particle receptor